MDSEIQTGLDGLVAETKKLFDAQTTKINAQTTKINELKASGAALQAQVDAIDSAHQHRHVADGPESKSLGQMFVESQQYLDRKQAQFMGRAPLNVSLNVSVFPLAQKSTITDAALGAQTTGVIQLQRLPGVVGLPQQALRVRDLIPVRPQTAGNTYDYVKQTVRTNAPSPQVEGQPKGESTYLWAALSGPIQTIAHFTNVSRQALDDVPWLRSTIDSELTYGLKVKEEAEILSGDGTGVHLDGIIPQATAFDTTKLSASKGWTYLDQLRYAKLQVRRTGLATFAPSAYVLNPDDVAAIELIKDSLGLYVIGDPRTGVSVKYIWNLPVVESDSITAGTFLCGAFDTAVEIVDRLQATVDISFEHGTNFTSNLGTILCEERVGLAVRRANAFVVGSFSSSPA